MGILLTKHQKNRLKKFWVSTSRACLWYHKLSRICSETTATKGKPASIINIASIDGIRVPLQSKNTHIVLRKQVIHLTRPMAGYLAPRNITVNAISPGLFPSKMGSQVLTVMGDEALGKMIPMEEQEKQKILRARAYFLAALEERLQRGPM